MTGAEQCPFTDTSVRGWRKAARKAVVEGV